MHSVTSLYRSLIALSLVVLRPVLVGAECKDSDGGGVSTIAGIVEVVNSKGISSLYPDYCEPTGKNVVEYYCSSSGSVATSRIPCRFGCYGGTCSNRNESGNKACYVMLTFQETVQQGMGTKVLFKDVATTIGDFSFEAHDYFGTPADYLLELRTSKGILVGTFGALSAARPPIVEDFTPKGPVSYTRLTPKPGAYSLKVTTPFDATVTSYKLLNASTKSVLAQGPLSVSSLTCAGGCIPAGETGAYYSQECCPGLTPIYSKQKNTHLFTCSLCTNRLCLPVRGSVLPPLTTSRGPTPSPTITPVATGAPMRSAYPSK